MMNMYLMDAQSKLRIAEHVERREFNRAIRIQAAKKAARKTLHREIGKLLKVDHSAQSVLDVLEQVIPEQTALRIDSTMRTSCGT